MTQTIFEKSQPGQHAYSLPYDEEEFQSFLPSQDLLRKTPLPLPEISEINLTRHFCGLARKNVGIDNQFYPLGSCTMKLNPRVNEWAAGLTGFVRTHPFAPEETVQGNLALMHELVQKLCGLCGMAGGTLAPNAGAQGEFVGLRMIFAYHQQRGDALRTEILIPDNAHGTNPATAALAGFKTITIKSNEAGDISLEDLKTHLSERTAGLMLTNPNTLGLFSTRILEIAQLVHESGGLLYYDGANLNPLLNVARAGEMGFDVMHINMHKTFSTPHGGGGPGSGPVLCNESLKPYLPVPRIEFDGSKYSIIWEAAESIGQVSSFYGNFGICLRAYLYILLHGQYGLRKVAEMSVLNANYLKKKISQFLTVPFSQPCMHEFVVQADKFLSKGIRALDIAKRILDYGNYAPTIYFPLIIKECMLIEPTECESKDTLDNFVEILTKIIEEIEANPELVKTAPHLQSVGRLDETSAAKKPVLKHCLF